MTKRIKLNDYYKRQRKDMVFNACVVITCIILALLIIIIKLILH